MNRLVGTPLDNQREWPDRAEEMYERVEILGSGSFGTVWMAQRLSPPENEYDDEFVALKNIELKRHNDHIFAEREISILQELRHPNIIRLIRAFPAHRECCRLVVLQLARGPNLQHVVAKRGALGIPLARLVARHLIAAVSYLHGRAVLHRDIKPTNCILENVELRPQDTYRWMSDDSIWSDGKDAEIAVARNKWKLMLVDFGFARALEEKEIFQQKNPLRQSIVNEAMSMSEIAKLVADELQDDEEIEKEVEHLRKETMLQHSQDFGTSQDLGSADDPAPDGGRRRASSVSIQVPIEVFDEESAIATSEDAFVSPSENATSPVRKRPSFLQPRIRRSQLSRQSTARTKVRSMSALGTKAYAAPEIKHAARSKTPFDMQAVHLALTNCVSDYGMIVDAYSVGWTLRVMLTGVPPTTTISQYLAKINEPMEEVTTGCLCFRTSTVLVNKPIKVRDTSDLPKEAANLIAHLTKVEPERRMTVREAQNHPWIQGLGGEKPYKLPEGDIPSKHGDPVVPLVFPDSKSFRNISAK